MTLRYFVKTATHNGDVCGTDGTGSDIYYETCSDIAYGSELLVYYDIIQFMGIPIGVVDYAAARQTTADYRSARQTLPLATLVGATNRRRLEDSVSSETSEFYWSDSQYVEDLYRCAKRIDRRFVLLRRCLTFCIGLKIHTKRSVWETMENPPQRYGTSPAVDSHNVICHPTQVNAPHLNPRQEN